MDPIIPDGCVLLARKIGNSKIWFSKPSWWLKVWIYLLTEVNHKDYKNLKRGQGFFTRDKIFSDCFLVLDGIKAQSVDNLMRWLKSAGQITTQKTTRGMFITICNYKEYQNILNYKNDTENDAVNDIYSNIKN